MIELCFCQFPIEGLLIFKKSFSLSIVSQTLFFKLLEIFQRIGQTF